MSDPDIERQWALKLLPNLTPVEEAARILADYVAQIIDYHQGWRDDMPHTDLETLGGAVSAVRRGTT